MVGATGGVFGFLWLKGSRASVMRKREPFHKFLLGAKSMAGSGRVGFGLRVWLDGTLGYIDFGAPAEGQADWGTQSLGHRAWLPVSVRVKGLYYYHQYLRMAEVGGILN